MYRKCAIKSPCENIFFHALLMRGGGRGGGGRGGGRRGLLDIIAHASWSSATYSFSYTYCIKSRLILLYIPGQQADIGQLRVQMAFEILDQKIKWVWQSVWNRDTNETGECFFFETVLSKKMSFPYSLFNQWKFFDSLPLCAEGDIGEISRFTKKLWNVLLLPLFQW